MENLNQPESISFTRTIPIKDSEIRILDITPESPTIFNFEDSIAGACLYINLGEAFTVKNQDGISREVGRLRFNIATLFGKNNYASNLEEDKKYLLFYMPLSLDPILNYLLSNVCFIDFLTANDKGVSALLFEVDHPISQKTVRSLEEMASYEQLDEIMNPVHDAVMRQIVLDGLENFKRLATNDNKSFRSESDIKILVDFEQYLRENASKRESVVELAVKSGASLTKFKRILFDFFEISPGKYRDNELLNMSMVLLITTDLTIAEITQTLGYAHEQSFSRPFKNLTGLLPDEFRKINQSKLMVSADGPAAQGCTTCPVFANKDLCVPITIFDFLRKFNSGKFSGCANCPLA